MRLLLFILCLSCSALGEDLALSIGRSASWPVSSSGSISVSNGSLIRVGDLGHSVQITGLKLGSAVVRSGLRTLQVNVIPEASYRVYSALHAALEGRRGLSLTSESGELRVSGRLLRAEDWLAIASALPDAPAGAFTFAATVEPDVLGEVRAKLNERLRAVGLAHVDFRFTPAAIATVGLEPRDARERASRVLAPFGIRVEANSSVLTLEPLVRVRIVVAEVKKSFKRDFGFRWPSALGGVLLPDFSVAFKGADFQFDMLEDRGWGRVLASPNLLCRSGKEAEFMAGGEFPIKISSFKSSEVVWKNYGVMLRVKPVADVSGRMSIAIETEVSELDDAHKVENVPGLLTNRMQTHFDLTRSRTIALSGLIKSSQSRQTSGLPGLSSIPILGPLFGSSEFKDDQSELVIFVTPEVLKADDEDLEKTP